MWNGQICEIFICICISSHKWFRPTGISEINFMINERPTGGSVDVLPKSGFAYQTKFSVRGSGFSDYEDGSSMSFYKFGYRLYTGGPITWFHEGSELQTPSFWIVINEQKCTTDNTFCVYFFCFYWILEIALWKWRFWFLIESFLLMTDWVFNEYQQI